MFKASHQGFGPQKNTRKQERKRESTCKEIYNNKEFLEIYRGKYTSEYSGRKNLFVIETNPCPVNNFVNMGPLFLYESGNFLMICNGDETKIKDSGVLR